MKKLGDREIDRREAEKTLLQPDDIIYAGAARRVYQRRYYDGDLEREMLLRIVAEETDEDLRVITLYRTSRHHRYRRTEADEH